MAIAGSIIPTQSKLEMKKFVLGKKKPTTGNPGFSSQTLKKKTQSFKPKSNGLRKESKHLKENERSTIREGQESA